MASPSSDTETAEVPPEAPAPSAAEDTTTTTTTITEGGEVLACSKCGENCWAKGWFLQAEEGDVDRESLCDDCFLVCPNIKGADRCLLGQVKIIPKKDKKPKAAKKKGPKAKH